MSGATHPERPPDPKRRGGLPLHARILIGLAVGVGTGVAANTLLGGDSPGVAWAVSHVSEPIGALFLRLILMLVVPLVFSSLIVGVAGIGDLGRLGRVGLKTFAYTVVLSAISVAIGLGVANTIRPGERMDAATKAELEREYGSAAAQRVEESRKAASTDSPLMKVVQTVVPSNPFAAIAGVPANPSVATSAQTPDMLHLMFFALALGLATTLMPASVTAPFVQWMEALYQISAALIGLIMRMAPVAVACLLFTNTARFGPELLTALAWFIVAVLTGLSLHMFGVYSLSVWLLSRISPLEFFRRIRTAMLTAFSTSSSNATLPTALRVAEENLGVPRHINSFVLTIGATANQNGTALYEGVTVLFLAQLAGVELSLAQQVTVAYLAILGGIGTAGVPSGSIPFIILVLATIGVDPALIAIILGVDRILDMCRTTLNVAGDMAAATYVARSEGHVLLGPPRGGGS
jgi:DAACS family dicarboxylate/amino acid:cation (Na+ or H+) symporter